MSLVGREFNIHRNFGPYVVRSTISDELHKILLDTANKIRKNKKLKKDNDYRKNLAGNLTEEYSYANAFTAKEEKIVEEELVWLASEFTKLSNKIIHQNLSREPKDIIMQKPVWVNFMKEGEWNPIHNHTGDLSCVTYLQVPDEIKEENNSSDTSSKSNTPSAGKLEFNYGDQIGYCNTGCIMSPREKDIYIFPAKLHHSVYPFKSKVERISVSVNFADKVNAMRNLQAEGER
tara:strand:+ start:79 stop:777 length:699 start_codon:yes stop_codon:yes gene_type:complete